MTEKTKFQLINTLNLELKNEMPLSNQRVPVAFNAHMIHNNSI